VIYERVLKGEPLKFYDSVCSFTSTVVEQEMREEDAYDFESIGFRPGDVVIDIGGNIGMVSILLAKKYPFLRIYAFEPVRQSFENFLRNLEMNEIPPGTVVVENMAVTKDSRDVSVRLNYVNLGASKVSSGGINPEEDVVPSVTLQQIVERNGIGKIKLLKIDCEGSEYEIIHSIPPEIFSNIEYLSGEFHPFKYDGNSEYTPENLYAHCLKYIDKEKIAIETSLPIDKV
jgi:FkbM family methyltransferase